MNIDREIGKVVVVGHTGFIGATLMRRLRQMRPDLEIVGLSLSEIDLARPEGAEAMAQHLGPRTAVVMCAAIKRQHGDSADIFLRNTEISVNFANLIAAHPLRRVVYLSSAAVYGEDIENLSIDEAAPINCRTHYGLAKMTAEWQLTKAAAAHPDLSLGLVRPATIYGPGDLGTAYGPSGFLTATLSNKPVVLWGDGMELREFVYIDDVAEVLLRYTFLDHRGPINLVTGRSYTFADVLQAVAKACGRMPEVTSRPRSKDKVDNRFDNALLLRLLPDFRCTTLEDGVARMHAAMRRTANADQGCAT